MNTTSMIDPPDLPAMTPTSIPSAWFAAAGTIGEAPMIVTTRGRFANRDADEAASLLLAHARHFRDAEMTP
jgi:hypothetical protein